MPARAPTARQYLTRRADRDLADLQMNINATVRSRRTPGGARIRIRGRVPFLGWGVPSSAGFRVAGRRDHRVPPYDRGAVWPSRRSHHRTRGVRRPNRSWRARHRCTTSRQRATAATPSQGAPPDGVLPRKPAREPNPSAHSVTYRIRNLGHGESCSGRSCEVDAAGARARPRPRHAWRDTTEHSGGTMRVRHSMRSPSWWREHELA
jgi:hypothetical protein